MEQETPRAHHDMGGVPKFMCEPVDLEPHALTEFDREVDAIRGIRGAKKIMSVDELRRSIESIPEDQYHKLSYYRRWIRSIADNLLRKGIFTEAELRAALGEPFTPHLPATQHPFVSAGTRARSPAGRRATRAKPCVRLRRPMQPSTISRKPAPAAAEPWTKRPAKVSPLGRYSICQNLSP
jgi:hypothetical protein